MNVCLEIICLELELHRMLWKSMEGFSELGVVFLDGGVRTLAFLIRVIYQFNPIINALELLALSRHRSSFLLRSKLFWLVPLIAKC